MQSTRVQNRNLWQRHVAAAESSSKSAATYCRDHNLNLTSFYIWRRKFRAKNVREVVPATNPFARLEVIREASPSLPEAQWLADFVRHLIQGGGQ